MQAIVFEEFGGPDVLHVKEVAEPHAGPGEIRVAVKAAGVNPMDYKIRHGWMEQAFATPLPAVPGLEIAGVVDEIGAGVTDVAVGDDVLGWSATGAYAQYALAETAVPKPASLGWAEAAAIPVAGRPPRGCSTNWRCATARPCCCTGRRERSGRWPPSSRRPAARS